MKKATRKVKSLIPPDFPNKYRLGGKELFIELLGGPGNSTFARYLVEGVVPSPDTKLGGINKWRETTMAEYLAKAVFRTKGQRLVEEYKSALGIWREKK